MASIWGNVARCVAAWLCLSSLASCTPGFTEFGFYDQAFDAQHAQGERVLDRLSTAERTVMQRAFSEKLDIREFHPDLARYYLETGDAPATASLRSSLRAVRDYNKVLLGLANGEGANLVRARVTEIATTLDSTGTLIRDSSATLAATGAAGSNLVEAMKDLCAACGAAMTIARQLSPAFDEILKLQTYAEFRSRLIAQYPHMRALLVRLREGSQDIYRIVVRANSGTSLATGIGINPAARDDLLQFRRELAAWVVMLDQTLLAMDAAVQAARSPTQLSATALLSQSIKLREAAITAEIARSQ
ncbi:hypothetical protein [Ciceribacter sp. L1K22]|uniref:hypothetical protein n=1 Tax=Ciceribacter sp. L1K22 TaxID=2820275 RepID=UPI001ABDFD38|nr:hypothetical protein [Ciceribacter sp. L1K22]MBO3759401.1 hypothetical protein [Ciceribacter sp. L1K22]